MGSRCGTFFISIYDSLPDAGWRMKEIDRMDMPGFLKAGAWDTSRAKGKAGSGEWYIDGVWPGSKP